MKLLIPLILLVAAAQPGSAGEAAFDAQRSRQLRVLKKGDAAADVRLHAVQWLGQNIRDPDDGAVVPALEAGLKDADPKVRAAAVEARGKLALRGKMPCPVGVIAAMLDADPGVRDAAVNGAGAFPSKRYSQDAAPVLLRCLKAEHPAVRGLAARLLAELPTKEAAFASALRLLVDDNDVQVANDARLALFRLTGDFAAIVPYGLRFRVEQRDAARIQTGKKLPAEKLARNTQMMIDINLRLHQLIDEQPDGFARYLLGLLAGDDAGLRRATALYLADYFREEAQPPLPSLPDDPVPFIGKEKPGQKLLDPETRRKGSEASAKKQALFRQRLREQGLEKRLRQLRGADPEALVRGAAAQALWAMEALQKAEKALPGGK